MNFSSEFASPPTVRPPVYQISLKKVFHRRTNSLTGYSLPSLRSPIRRTHPDVFLTNGAVETADGATTATAALFSLPFLFFCCPPSLSPANFGEFQRTNNLTGHHSHHAGKMPWIDHYYPFLPFPHHCLSMGVGAGWIFIRRYSGEAYRKVTPLLFQKLNSNH